VRRSVAIPSTGHTERVRAFRLGELVVLASLVLPAPAVAQQDGVFIDPDSPSAKEYGIPFEDERRWADPGAKPSEGIVQGARSSPLFGVGIVSGHGAEAAGSTARTGSPDGDARKDRGIAAHAGDADGLERDSDEEVLEAATSNPGSPAGGIGVPLTIGGVAVGVLLIGGLAGLLLRRRA
jgi:hypothetical protein